MGVKICRIPSMISSSSKLFISISSFTSLSSLINPSKIIFCSLRNYCLFFISFFCYQVRFKEDFSSLNHYYFYAYFYSAFEKRCLSSAALHIMYRWRAGRLRFTICLKYSLMVLILYFPVAPILDLRLSISSLI